MARPDGSSVADICKRLQASITSYADAASSADFLLSADGHHPLLASVEQLAESLAEVSAFEVNWQEHRSHILATVARGLAEPSCLKVVVEKLRQFVYPGALMLLTRMRTDGERSATLLERGMYAMSHLVHDLSLQEPILEFLRASRPVFHFVLADAEAKGGLGRIDLGRCKLVCETVLRLLSAQVVFLRTLWDWHAFSAFCKHPDDEVRQLASAAISRLVGLHVVGDEKSQAMERISFPPLQAPILPMSFWSSSDDIDESRGSHCFSGSAAMSEDDKMIVESAPNKYDGGVWQEAGVRACHGVCFQSMGKDVVSSTPFVATPTAMDAMRALLLSIGTGKPVLVSGAAGVGKTSFLRRAAELFGQTEPVFLYCDEQTDIKLLLGTYTCGKVVGEFVWSPGVITEALRQGRWLVLEDVDRVPAEILATLLPLADSRCLTLPDRNQTIEARLGFHLFGTLSTGSGRLGGGGEDHQAATEGGSSSTECMEFPGRVPAPVAAWTRVQVPTPTDEDLGTIITGLYPELQTLVPQLLSSAAVLCKGTDGSTTAGGNRLFTNSGVSVGPRELLCWCNHLKHARLTLAPIFTEESRTMVLREAAVVLLGRVPDAMLRRELLARIASIWGLAGGVAEGLLEERPCVQVDLDKVVVGPVVLRKASAGEWMGAPFAYTSVHARVLQALVSSIRCDKPVLLVGDTGTGKTSVVQHLGELLREKVLVYNFSEQSESSELIGGFRPVDVVLQAMSELNLAFSDAFKVTFSRRKNAKLLERAHHEFVARRWTAFLQVVGSVADKALKSLSDTIGAQAAKGVRATQQTSAWQRVRDLSSRASTTIVKGTAPHFEFLEGLLVQALRTGAWVVLDEINLAPGDILQRIQGLIERSPGMQLALPESGDERILPHKNFRIFACMNPPRLPTSPLLDAPNGHMDIDRATDSAGAGEEKQTAAPGFRAGQGAGKKELPAGIRARFTEIFVDEVRTTDDVGRIVRGYLERNFPSPPVDAVVKFFAQVKSLAHECELLDGSGKVAHFSLRNLTRALRFGLAAVRRPHHATPAMLALAQGLAVGFATPLDRASAKRIEALIHEAMGVSPIARSGAKAPASTPSSSKKAVNVQEETANIEIDKEKHYVCVEGYWIKAGACPIDAAEAHKDFVITGSVRHHLQNIARMLSGGRFPVLLEGPTSAGKTSLVKFVAKLTGHECVRINNHEHTDLQEYLGQYVCDPSTGQLVFQEGVLARAARAGHWVVLDELNLAPSEVLEALNRLLDDNRELFIADTGETIKPHEDFMVFATQNPAGGLYGGRKLLSRAFRNRFTEGFITELPMEELAVILHKRCEVPPSFVKIMLKVYEDLQSHRCQTAVFQGKQSFMTVRDLLRWGNRKPASQYDLAMEGYALLAERLRKDEDRQVVKASLQKHCPAAKNLQIDYSKDPFVADIRERLAARLQAGDAPPSGIRDVVWTPAFCRMCALIGRCIRTGEPALLIGETGGGKTMACQVLSWVLVEQGDPSRHLRILNCHQQTETSDFIGSLRPVRGREALLASMVSTAGELLATLNLRTHRNGLGPVNESERFKQLRGQLESFGADAGNPKMLIQSLRMALTRESDIFQQLDGFPGNIMEAGEEDQPDTKKRRMEDSLKAADTEMVAVTTLEEAPEATKENRTSSSSLMLARRLLALCARWEQIFEWADGALVETMRAGGAFLVDEISLADDSVLERLNSVLEPECFLLLAEKPQTTTALEVVHAKPTFRLFATMNPGGDFGKRELSPALRNRFTEIWVESIDFSTPEAETLLASQLSWPLLAKPMLRAVIWFNQRVLYPLTIREVLAWSSFISKTAADGDKNSSLAIEMYIHGGCMTLVDSLGLGNRMTDAAPSDERSRSEEQGCLTSQQYAILQFLVSQVNDSDICSALEEQARLDLRASFGMGGFAWVQGHAASNAKDATALSIGRFRVESVKRDACVEAQGALFDFSAPSTACNVGRLVRAMQQPKAVLLEGPPGLGKTATVQALAKATGRRLLRINLSEQTDLIDLLGSDLPAAGAETVTFKWCDGALLRAMKAGDWVLLDEINLAPQATLEGLNALLDHRREVFLPAIGQTISAHPGFRIFAAQNPVTDGGGRKGLPRSFLNRFTRVVLTSLSLLDLQHICQHCYSSHVDTSLINCAVDLVEALRKASNGGGDSGPPFDGYHEWDWNLRDALRLCELLQAGAPLANQFAASAELLFVSRLHTDSDRAKARTLISRFSPRSGACNISVDGSFRGPILHLRNSALGHVGSSRSGPGATLHCDTPTSSGDVMLKVSETLRCSFSHLYACANGVQVGTASLPKRLKATDPRCWAASEHTHKASHLTPIPCQASQLHAIAHAISPQLRLPVLLVGASASGKRSSVQWLASAVGMPLQEIPLTTSLDASELLGCFEQVDAEGRLREFIHGCRETSDALIRVAMLRDACKEDHALTQRIALCLKQCNEVETYLDSSHDRNMQAVLQAVEKIVHALGQCANGACDDISTGNALTVTSLAQIWSSLKTKCSGNRFEWVDGPLVTALQTGSWVLLSHVEHAAPAVLDRLNSVLEPNGFLLLTESGEERLIRPHPDFRIFFTLTLGVAGQQVSRALRNRCIEIFMGNVDQSRRGTESFELSRKKNASITKSGSFTMHLEFLHEVLHTLVQHVEGATNENPRSMQFIKQALAPCVTDPDAEYHQSPLPSPAFLIDALHVVAAKAPLKASVLLHIAVLHTLTHSMWIYLQDAISSSGNLQGQTGVDRESRDLWAHQLMASGGFSWRTLQKFVDLFMTSVAQQVQASKRHKEHSTPLVDSTSIMKKVFLQIYVSEVSGGKCATELFSTIFGACSSSPLLPQFQWLADAAQRQPRAMHLRSASETEARQLVQPLSAAMRQGASSKELLSSFRLLLERPSMSSDEVGRLLCELGEPFQTWNQASQKYFAHPLLQSAIPQAVAKLRELTQIQDLYATARPSVQNAWVLVDMSSAVTGPNSGDINKAATHLRELLRCAKVLSLHMRWSDTADTHESAWEFSKRFQDGVIPVSHLPHPVLAVAQPLIDTCAAGLVDALACACMGVVDHTRTSQELQNICQSMAIVGRIEEELRKSLIRDKTSKQDWLKIEAKTLCLFQQMYSFLTSLENAPWLKRANELFEQLRVHLATAGLAWDPDTKRLQRFLAPLRDSMSTWGGLGPPLREPREFLVEQLLFGIAHGQVGHRVRSLSALSGLLAALRVRQQTNQEVGQLWEVLSSSIIEPSVVGPSKAADISKEGCADLSSAPAHHAFLVLEAVHMFGSFVGRLAGFLRSDMDDHALLSELNDLLSRAAQQLQHIENAFCATKACASARQALIEIVAEIRVLEWALGGSGPWKFVEDAGLPKDEYGAKPAGSAHSLCERAMFALRKHLNEALASAFVEDSNSSQIASMFTMSPATLTRLRPPWSVESALPVVASLVVRSGFTCTWALNLSAAVPSLSTMANHRLSSCQLESLFDSCLKHQASDSASSDWAILCNFLSTQFYGLQTLATSSTGIHNEALANVCKVLISWREKLYMPAASELGQLQEQLLSLRAGVEHVAEHIAKESHPSSVEQWPMPFPALAENFILPIMDLLIQRCQSSERGIREDSGVHGAMWVAAAMWRIHSGGGMLVPGGLEFCEAASQVRADFQNQVEHNRGDLLTRTREELAIYGRWACHAGAIADITCETRCLQDEIESLGELCRLRPPLAEEPGSRSLAALSAVCVVCPGQPSPGYQELCQEIATFSMSVARPDRICRLVSALGKTRLAPPESETMVLSELHNLATSAHAFVQRIQTRFPLHTDLVAPVVLAISQLLHGLYLVHENIWYRSAKAHGEKSSEELGTLPQAPAFNSGGPLEVLGEDVQDNNPEVVSWWLRWVAILRHQQPTVLTAPRPVAVLELLRALSRQYLDEEQKQAVEEMQKQAPFKMSKSMSEALAEQEDDEELPSLFPGMDQEEIEELLGLQALEERIKQRSFGVDEADDNGTGGSIYDLWSTGADKSSGKNKSGGFDQMPQNHLNENALVDLCSLSLEAFEFEREKASTQDNQAEQILRAEALDASLELFVRQHVARPVSDGIKVQSVLLSADAATHLLPLVMMRVKRTIGQLTPIKHLANVEDIGIKRSAREGSSRLHGNAACGFYAESNPGILLQLAAPLRALLARIQELLLEYDAHPTLLALEGIVEKMLQLRLLQTTPMVMVTMLEVLLGRAAAWEEIASKAVSLATHLRPLETLTVGLRERQLLEWRSLRQNRSRHFERQGAKWWFHLIGLLADAKEPRNLIDELLRFIRTSTLAQFRLRMRMLRAAAHLHLEAEGDKSPAGGIALHVHNYASKWVPVVEKALTKAEEVMEKEVQDLVKIVRWDISNYQALKESVSRSHKQLSKVIKRFDESLQELADFQLASSTSLTPNFSLLSAVVDSGRPEISKFVITASCVQGLRAISGHTSTDSQAPAERVSDNESFWSDSARVMSALPSMLQGCRRIVSQHILPETFCFAAPSGQSSVELGFDLCSEISSVQEALQDESNSLPVKRRRLQGLREECARFRILPRPLTNDAFDVMVFFSSPMMPPFEAASDVDGQNRETSNAAKMEPPLKRMRTDEEVQNSRSRRESDEYCSQSFTRVWARIEALTSEVMHLALRLHSVKEKPDDLPAADLQLWLGLASASLHSTRLHRERCIHFARELQRFSSACGATLVGSSVAVSHTCLLAVFNSLDRLLEGSAQARVFIEKIASGDNIQSQLSSLDSAIAELRSTLQVIGKSDEYRAYFGLGVDQPVASCTSKKVRVKTTFLVDLIARAEAAGQLLKASIDGACNSLPDTTKHGLRGILSDLLKHLEIAQHALEASTVSPNINVSWQVLRKMLLSVQESRQAMVADGSLCARAITQTELGQAIDWEGSDIVPHLGVGRSSDSLRSLLEILPISQLLKHVNSHIEELPECSVESPLAIFAEQVLHLGRAVLLCGLESALAMTQISLRLLWMVSFLVEHGLGTKPEEGDDAQEDDGNTEWKAGTGMGEGDGLKDVTEEIEDEAQLEGTRGEKEEEKQKPPDMPEDGKEDTAKEVGFDFDAEAQGVPEQKEQEGQDQKDKDEENDLDRQTGDVDLSAGGKLDDKLWNGDDEDDKDKPDEQEQGKDQKEDIEAHGAQGEGETETTAPEDTKDGKKKNEKDKQDQNKGQEDQQNKEDDAEQQPEMAEEGCGKVDDGERDAQFDVNMQPQGQAGEDGEGEGEGEGEGDENKDADLDLDQNDLNLDGGDGDDGDQDMDLDGNSENQEKDEMDLDGVDGKQPPNIEEMDENETRDSAIDTCLEGEATQSEEKGDEQKETDPVQGQHRKDDEKPVDQEQPKCQGDAKPQPKNKESAPAQKSDEQVFGGSTGEATAFESQPSQAEADNADASNQQDKGSMAPTSGSQQNSTEMPSARPDPSSASSQQSKPSAQQTGPPEDSQDAQERHLQKVDIVREAEDGDMDVGEEQKQGAEKGLHMADQRSGVDALGECKDQDNVPNQAIGMASTEDDENNEEVTAMEEDKEEVGRDGTQKMETMAMQQMDEAMPDSLKPRAEAEGENQEADTLRSEGLSGSGSTTNVAIANVLPLASSAVDDTQVEAMDVETGETKRKKRSDAEVRELWAWLEGCTTPLAAALCEQLRTILEPTLKGRLQGFYRTGKRISMRRVIPFIASNYRRDKIWLRRTKPSKREYQIIVALDNSRSMKECGVGPMALQTLCIVCQALAQLEVGEYAVLAFGSDKPRALLSLGAGQPHAAVFGWEQARPLLEEFTFDEESADSHNRGISDLMQRCSQLFDERNDFNPRPFCQVTLLISDGRFNKAKVRAWVHAALSQQQLPLLIIVDSNTEGSSTDKKATGSRRSVFDIKAVTYEGGKCNVVPYLQDFPFPYYVVVQDLQALPSVLSDVLKQWFELVAAV